jgi:hypothetical protein
VRSETKSAKRSELKMDKKDLVTKQTVLDKMEEVFEEYRI